MGLIDELAKLQGVTATGGGYGYDPTQEYNMEVRFAEDGTPYNARAETPLIPGHTRAGPMFNAPSVEVPTEPSLLNYGENYYSGTPFVPQDVSPTIQSAVNPTQEQSVDPMSLYNRQGRADYTPQDTYNPNTIWGDPSLESLPDPTMDAYAEQDYYAEQERQAKIEAQYQALLKAQGIKEEELESYNIPDPREALMQDVGYPTTGPMSPNTSPDTLESLLKAKTLENRSEWDMRRADDQFNNLDNQYDVANQVATDDFGNELFNANEHGQTRYDINAIKQESLDNLMMKDREPVVTPPVVAPTDNKPNYPSHLTPYAIKMLEEQRKRNEMFQGIGDTATGIYEGAKTLGSDIYDDVTGFDYKGLGSDIYKEGADAVQGAKDLYQDFTKPDTRTHTQKIRDAQTNYAEPVKEFITDTIPEFVSDVDVSGTDQVNTVLDLNQQAGDAIIGYIENSIVGETYKDWKSRETKELGKGAVLDVIGTNLPTSIGKSTEGVLSMVEHPIETGKAIIDVASGALQHVLPDDWSWNKDDQKMATQAWEMIVEDYGSLEAFRKTLAERPAEAIPLLFALGLISKVAAVATVRKLNDPALLDKVESMSKAIDPTNLGPSSEMFMGGSAKYPPKGLEQAKKMLDNEGGKYSNVLEKKIWTATGWHQLPDGNWAFEISDKKLSFKNLDDAEDVIMGSGVMPEYGGVLGDFTNGSLFKHDELYRQYPEIEGWVTVVKYGKAYARGIDGGVVNPYTGTKGSFNPLTKEVTVYVDPIQGFTADTMSTWLHEIQHGIQELENWMSGGTNSASFMAKLEQSLRNDQRPFAKDKRKYDKHAFQYEYANKLEQRDYWKNFANSDNLTGKARHIYNNQLWYKHSTEIRKLYGAPPKKHNIAKHNEYLRNVAKFYEDEYSDSLWKIKEGTKYSDRGSIDSEWMLEVDNMTVKNKTASIERKMDKNRTNVVEWNNIQRTVEEIRNATDSDTRTKIYKRLQGEVQARNTQDRMGLGDKGRAWAAPFETMDTYNTDVIYTKTPTHTRVNSGNLPWNMTSKGDGDFYIQRVGPNAGKVSKTRNGPSDIAFSTDKGALDSDYAYYAVMSLEKQLQSRAHGTAQQAINMTDVDAVLTDLFQNMNKVDSKVDDGVLGQFGKTKGTFYTADELGKEALGYDDVNKFVTKVHQRQSTTKQSIRSSIAKDLGGEYSGNVEVPEGIANSIGDRGSRISVNGNDVYFHISVEDDVIYLPNIAVSGKNKGLGTKFMDAMKNFADETSQDIVIYKVTNDDFFRKFDWLEETKSGGSFKYKAKKGNKSFGLGELDDIWNKAHKVDDGEGLLKIKKKVTKPKNGLLD